MKGAISCKSKHNEDESEDRTRERNSSPGETASRKPLQVRYAQEETTGNVCKRTQGDGEAACLVVDDAGALGLRQLAPDQEEQLRENTDESRYPH